MKVDSMEPVLIIIIVIALLIIGYISIYNKIQDYIVKIEKAEGIIDEDLRNKYDILLKINTYFTNVNEKNQKDYLKDLKELKQKEISNFELERKLMESETLLLDVYNDNIKYQENEELKQLLKDLQNKNEKITAGISYYNNYTNKLNAYIRKIPNNFVAITSRIKPKPFFDGKNMNDTNINDFKL